MTRFRVISVVYEHQTLYSIESDVWSTCRGSRVEGTWAASTADFCLGSGAYYRCYDSFFLNFKKMQILKREVSEERQTSKNSVFLEKSSFVKF